MSAPGGGGNGRSNNNITLTSEFWNSFLRDHGASSPQQAPVQSSQDLQASLDSILNQFAASSSPASSRAAPPVASASASAAALDPSPDPLQSVFSSILNRHATMDSRPQEGRSTDLQSYFNGVLSAEAQNNLPIEEMPADVFCRRVKEDPLFAMNAKHSFPPLYDAAVKDDIDVVRNILTAIKERKKARQAREQEISERLRKNPMDPEAQRMVEDDIRSANAEKNRQYAMDHHPEAFVRVDMLYIDCSVNKEPMIAMVDTGAESCVMSLEFARRCRIDMMMDTSYSGLATGVGTAKIVGKVWSCDIRIGNVFYVATFSVVESYHLDFLLGLDFMRRYQCCVDIGHNCIRIGENAVPFLPPERIPRRKDEKTEEK